MKLYYGRGLYTPTRALTIRDCRMDFYQAVLLDYVLKKTIDRDKPNIDAWYKEQLDAITLSKIECAPVEMSPDRTYGFPGSLYLQASMSNLRTAANAETLYVELDDVNNNRIFVLYRLRQIGYELEAPTGYDTEEYYSKTMDLLILMPGINSSEVPDFPEYLGSHYKHISYKKQPAMAQ